MTNSCMKAAAFFDFDGVVMNTEPQYSQFWGEQGRKYRIPVDNFESVIKGSTLKQIYDKYFAGMEAEQLQITHDLDLFEANMAYEYLPGFLDFVSELKNKNVGIALVTSSSEEKMSNVYRKHPEFTALFDEILTASMFKHSKPHPECYLLASEKLGVSPENCFVFEDSFHGLESGRKANMNVVGLATTNTRASIESKCDFVIDDFTDFSVDKMFSIAKANSICR